MRRDRRRENLTRLHPAPAPVIEVEIGELVLHGFNQVDRYEVGDALAAELQRLIVSSGIPNAGTDRPHVRAGDIQLEHGAPAATVGTRIAGSLHADLDTSRKEGHG